MNNNNTMLYGVVGFILGVVVMLVISTNAVNTNNTGMMRMMGIRSGTQKHMMQNGKMMDNDDKMMNNDEDESMSMSSMVEDLKGKTGDEFDKDFTELMIQHHQGAIDMAKLAQQYAGHEEVKNLANDIITAQTSEIEMMKTWRQSWGYEN